MDNRHLIGLLGCGWLGFPLAKRLLSEQFLVRATTTSADKLEVFKRTGIDPYLVQFSEDSRSTEMTALFEAGTLIISIPPGRRDPSGFNNYRQMVREVCRHLPGSKVKRLIFISSTSVYSDDNSTVDESSVVRPDTASGELMAETEAILANQAVRLVVLRLAGLIGPGRMPGSFFAGRTEVPNGLAPVNLVHLEDVIGVIVNILADRNAAGIYNVCAPSHPARADFYTLAAELEGLPQPGFRLERDKWKVISSNRVEQELKYTYKYPSISDWLALRQEE
jgi:nucleoside-diphosphate-sugar epimerase